MILNEVDFEELYDINTPAYIIACPNYEERSIHFLKRLKELKNTRNKSDFYAEILYLQNDIDNSPLLDGLKYESFKKIQESSIFKEFSYNRITYPDNFSSTELRSIIKNDLEYCLKKEDKLNIIMDISSMPRNIILELCRILEDIDINHTKSEMINRIFYLYVSPKEYSRLSYSQDIGTPYGFLSGQPLYKNNCPFVYSVIFPGREGYEGKLVLENLNSSCLEQRSKAFFSIGADDYLDSLRMMRANQGLLNSQSCIEEYYCSLTDGIKTLSDRLNSELTELEKGRTTVGKRLYIVAPFNSKIMLPASYYLLTKMQRQARSFGIDIYTDVCIMKGFQYTSVYSFEVGSVILYELNREELYKNEGESM